MNIGAVMTSIDLNTSSEVQKIPNTQVVSPASDVDGLDKENKKAVKHEEVKKSTEAMNQFLEDMNVNIRFKIHQKTNELMVQVIDQSNDKVLREFPPHEFLDTIAAIRSYVGMILDKKI